MHPYCPEKTVQESIQINLNLLRKLSIRSQKFNRYLLIDTESSSCLDTGMDI